jgi:hypothetical protein
LAWPGLALAQAAAFVCKIILLKRIRRNNRNYVETNEGADTSRLLVRQKRKRHNKEAYTSSLRRKIRTANEGGVSSLLCQQDKREDPSLCQKRNVRHDKEGRFLLVAEYAREGVTISLACYVSVGFMP